MPLLPFLLKTWYFSDICHALSFKPSLLISDSPVIILRHYCASISGCQSRQTSWHVCLLSCFSENTTPIGQDLPFCLCIRHHDMPVSYLSPLWNTTPNKIWEVLFQHSSHKWKLLGLFYLLGGPKLLASCSRSWINPILWWQTGLNWRRKDQSWVLATDRWVAVRVWQTAISDSFARWYVLGLFD